MQRRTKHKKHIKILITAGHAATTALTVLSKLKEDKETKWALYWVGAAQALEQGRAKPFESELFPKLGVQSHTIVSGKLQSKFTRHTIPALIKVPIGFVQSMLLLFRIKPQIVLSFGSSASLPIVLASFVMRIPIVVHEQTVAAGLANKIASRFANVVTLAREASRPYFPYAKTVIVGNPISDSILSIKPQTVLHTRPLIYITGGSRGAQRINNIVFEALADLLSEFDIVHQTGHLDFEKAQLIKANLPEKLQTHYQIHPFISPQEIHSVFSKASLLVGRSGANTVSETIALALPSVFIPIPWTRADEQTKNAQFAKSLGIAEVLPESQLTKTSLTQTIQKVKKNWSIMKKEGTKHAHIDRDATNALVSVLNQTL